MTRDEMAAFMQEKFEDEVMTVRAEGQKEYAHEESNAFANFQRAAADLAIDAKAVCWIFAMKHRDGIAAWLKGHRSQREHVTGRIKDLIVYLFILWAMIEEDEEKSLETMTSAEFLRRGRRVVSPSLLDPEPGEEHDS